MCPHDIVPTMRLSSILLLTGVLGGAKKDEAPPPPKKAPEVIKKPVDKAPLPPLAALPVETLTARLCALGRSSCVRAPD